MKTTGTLPAARFLPTITLLLISGMVCFTPVYGAEAPAGGGYALTRGTNEVGVWAGGSPDSVKIIGRTEDRNLFLLGLRYGRVLAAWDSISLQYTLDLFPVALMFEPDSVRRGRSTIYGGGLSPVGFKLNFGQQSRIKPFIAYSFGFLYFEEDAPVPGSSRFNLATEVGLGVQYFLAPKSAISLGYKLHHISNAGRSNRNPGVDFHLFYAGYSFFTP